MTQHISGPTTPAEGYDLRPPLAVWPCGQNRRTPHADEIARRLITELTAPDQVAVFLCHGDGMPMVLAAESGRRAYGLEVDPDRDAAAEQRITDQLTDEQRRRAVHRCGDARSAATLLDDAHSRAALAVVWLPRPGRYHAGAQVHGDHLGRLRGSAYNEAVGAVVTAAERLLRPGGHAALVCGGAREGGGHPDRVTACAHHAHAAGLVYLQHIIALAHPVDGYLQESEALGILGSGTLGPAHARAAVSVIHPAHDDVVLLHKPAEAAHGEGGR